MLLDLHVHSSGISGCCRIDVFETIDRAKKIGLDGMVLTNHYQKGALEKYGTEEYVKRYIEEYKKGAEYGETVGFKVFFGIEVTMEFDDRIHLLIYGVPENFLFENPGLCDMSQKELYETVHRYGGILVQAHPYRNECHVLDTDYLDALEINCHPKYVTTCCDTLEEDAKNAGLILTCGGDYHGDTPYRPDCASVLPDSLQTIQDIADFLLTTDTVKLRIHEVGEEKSYEKNFFIPNRRKSYKL